MQNLYIFKKDLILLSFLESDWQSEIKYLLSNMSQNVAPVKWAQRTDSVYLTISLPDVSNETINLTDRGLTFTGTSEGKSYHVELEFVSLFVFVNSIT